MIGNTLRGAATRHVTARELSQTAGKPNRGAPAYSRWVNRPIGRQLAILAFQAGMTPNQVTLASGAVSLCGIVLLGAGPATVPVGILVALLLALAYALDSADGQLARMQGTGSATGEWLDHVIDCLKIASLHMAVLVCWYRNFDLSPATLLVPIGFGIQASAYFFTKILTDALRAAHARPPVGGERDATPRPRAEEHSPALASLVVLPLDYGLLCLLFALLGFHSAFVWSYSALALAGGLLLGAGFVRWYRDLSRLG